jgi:hypothetical protein
LGIFNVADHAIVTDTIPPKPCKGGRDGFAEIAGAGCYGHPLFQAIQDALLCGAIELLQIMHRAAINFNCPAQVLVSRPQD